MIELAKFKAWTANRWRGVSGEFSVNDVGVSGIYVCLTMSDDDLKAVLYALDSLEAPELSPEHYDLLMKLNCCLNEAQKFIEEQQRKQKGKR